MSQGPNAANGRIKGTYEEDPMARNKTNQRSFFEWAIPDRIVDFSGPFKLGIVGLLLAVVLAYCGALTTRHLTVDGGQDEIAAGYPGFDGGIPRDQVAAAFPGQDDPEGMSIANESEKVDDEESQEDSDEDELPEEDTGAPISDDALDPVGLAIVDSETEVGSDISPLETGAWNLTIEESGAAECGYPEDSYEYLAVLTIGVSPEADLEAENVPANDDWEDTATLLRFNKQISFGSRLATPLVLIDGGEGWSSEMTVTEFDFLAGVFSATEVYTYGDCETVRVLVGVGF